MVLGPVDPKSRHTTWLTNYARAPQVEPTSRPRWHHRTSRSAPASWPSRPPRDGLHRRGMQGGESLTTISPRSGTTPEPRGAYAVARFLSDSVQGGEGSFTSLISRLSTGETEGGILPRLSDRVEESGFLERRRGEPTLPQIVENANREIVSRRDGLDGLPRSAVRARVDTADRVRSEPGRECLGCQPPLRRKRAIVICSRWLAGSRGLRRRMTDQENHQRGHQVSLRGQSPGGTAGVDLHHFCTTTPEYSEVLSGTQRHNVSAGQSPDLQVSVVLTRRRTGVRVPQRPPQESQLRPSMSRCRPPAYA